MFAASLDERGREHLEGRGIADQAATFGLGVVPGDSDLEWAPYRGMLSIPYLSASNQVVNIRFRNLSGHDPKYLQLPGTPVGPYNLKALTGDADTVVITEGEFDTIALAALGISAVGMPGAQSWKHHYARMFDGVQNVIVAGDPDNAGREFNAKVQKSIPRALGMYLEKDINDTYVQDGPMPILEAFGKAGGSL